MRKVYFFLILFLCMGVSIKAQEINVSGYVTSEEDGYGLPGVTIQVKGTSNGTITEIDGDYVITAGAKDTLVFSYVGYQTQNIAVNGRNKIDVVMSTDAVMLDNVVVTALGIKRQKRELGYATEDISGEDLTRSGSDNVINSLSGRAAGVQIITSDGVAGGSSRIVIRGNNSIFGDNQPLIVVDGVPMTNEGGVTGWDGGQDWGTALNNINQEDIEDLNILKGPTAAALYGSRGGNGVVLITTKKGKKQKGLGINFSSTYKLTTPYGYRDVQNKYGAGGPVSFMTPTLTQDENGNYIKADLRDYDIIISESQFKLWNCYSGVDDYLDKCHKNNLEWGVPQYAPKECKNVLKMNYQFLQTLNLNENDIKELCKPFVEWINGVSYNNFEYMLLFLLGVNNTADSIDNFLRSSDNYWLKSLVVNPELKNDKYIRSKIRELIKNKIQKGCMGDIYVDGNFQTLVSDPYAYMQHVCGLEPTGLLGRDEFYSNYWNERNVTQVDGMCH